MPPLEERLEIIRKAHDFGHFKQETICNLISRRYYWKTMQQDVKHYIANCLPCLRGDVKPTISHPAIALLVLEIFDRISIMEGTLTSKRQLCQLYFFSEF